VTLKRGDVIVEIYYFCTWMASKQRHGELTLTRGDVTMETYYYGHLYRDGEQAAPRGADVEAW